MSPFGLALGMGLLRREFDGGIPHPGLRCAERIRPSPAMQIFVASNPLRQQQLRDRRGSPRPLRHR